MTTKNNYGLNFKLPNDPRDVYTNQYIEMGSSLDKIYYGAPKEEIRKLKVENQKKHGSCVGQTMSKIKEYSLHKELSARYIYVLTDKFFENGNGGGLYPKNACTMLHSIGVVEDIYCEDNNSLLPRDYYKVSKISGAEHYRSSGYSYIPRNNVSELKKAFNMHKVLLLAVSKGHFTQAGTLEPGGDSNHAVMAFGIEKVKDRHKVYFLNSWGRSWGINGIGYFYIEDLVNAGTPFYFMAVHDVPENIITYNKAQYPLLRKGRISKAVITLQNILGITSDGIFGQQTKRHVISFQIKHFLCPDGIVGSKTWRKLLRKQ